MRYAAVMYTTDTRDLALVLLARPVCDRGIGLTFHFDQIYAGATVTVARATQFELTADPQWIALAPGLWAFGERSADAMPFEAARAAEALARNSLNQLRRRTENSHE
jgi:hypothetical protein